MIPLTKHQEQIMAFIIKHLELNHSVPVLPEIQSKCTMNSISSVRNAMSALIKKGWLIRNSDNQSWSNYRLNPELYSVKVEEIKSQ